MRVRAQSRAMPNVFNVGNVVKHLIWTRVMSETSTPLHAYGVDDDVGARSQSCSRLGSLQSNATGSLLASSEGTSSSLDETPSSIGLAGELVGISEASMPL